MSRLILMGLLGLAACTEVDPLTREGLWRPTGANAANLRAMVAVPSDLAYGTAAPYADGNTAARAVDRLRNGRVYPLPESTISRVGQSGSPAPTQAAPSE